ncbi:MAG: tetratricopeptide repeat protein [Clostridiales bacterium]|jgi:tetratricopeptide (TPR) repeat protein|nr:tetratricopeptide repeat protein [Clostridiales bacterium]
MKFLDNLKVRSALIKHQRGNKEEARAMYQQLYDDGMVQASYMLPYSVLLLREGGEENFQKVRELLVKAQKAPDLTDEKRQQLLMNYAIAVWKLGELDKAVSTLEASHRKAPNSLTYQALGFLYIETGDAQKALDYNLEALEYDDEDGITLDNLGQIYYRLLQDKDAARPYFEKAHEIKSKQIDTLYFLALYDEAEGKYADAQEKIEVALEGSFSPLNFVDKAKAQALYERILKAQGKDLPQNED